MKRKSSESPAFEDREELFSIEEDLENREIIRQYKKEIEKCQYCSGASVSGCRECPTGLEIQNLFKKYSQKQKGVEHWETLWRFTN